MEGKERCIDCAQRKEGEKERKKEKIENDAAVR